MDPNHEISRVRRQRLPEIEEVVLARVRSIEDPATVADPEYAQGLREAVHTALDYAVAVLEGDRSQLDPIPQALIAQARLAARNSVDLDTVLLRYLAGHSVLCDYLLQEVRTAPAALLQRTLRRESAVVERILAAVATAYREEVSARHLTADRRRTEQVRRLLAGEPQDPPELGYDLELWHIGAVATGAGAARAIRELAAALDRRLLLVRPGGDEVWAWLGGHRYVEATKVVEHARAEAGSDLVLAIGEPGRGNAGWRLTHHQARAALPIARRGQSRVVDYAGVALLATALGDEVLTRSLTELYLMPLAAERDGGVALRETLRAYFAAGRNVSSAAAALGVSRQTATSRLNAVQARIGRTLEACGTELETAMRLSDLGHGDASFSG